MVEKDTWQNVLGYGAAPISWLICVIIPSLPAYPIPPSPPPHNVSALTQEGLSIVYLDQGFWGVFLTAWCVQILIEHVLKE
jgi:hypothetical protein